MTEKTPPPDSHRASLLLALREVVDALDRRVPQLERAGETRIAGDALVLRERATRRIEELQRAADGGSGERPGDGITTDDGV